MTVNLGIGLPTRLVNYVDPGMSICLHSENGITGVGPALDFDQADRNLIDAGGAYVSTLPGAAFFDSAVSFSIVRRGRIDLTVLGAFEVAMNGDLANWMVPGVFAAGVGGGMELAQKARRVVIIMTHRDRQGKSKIVRECDLPITATACVHRICTDMAVIDVVEQGPILRQIAEGITVDEVIEATAAPLQIPNQPIANFKIVRASMLSIAKPVFIVLAAIALVDEWLSPLQWFGLVMVIGSLVVIELPKKRGSQAA